MAEYIKVEMHLKNVIEEAREVSRALYKFADELEEIEKKYKVEDDEEYEMVNLGNGLFEKRLKDR